MATANDTAPRIGEVVDGEEAELVKLFRVMSTEQRTALLQRQRGGATMAEILAAAIELPHEDRKLLQKYLLAIEGGLELDPASVRASGDDGLRALWAGGARA